MINRLTCEVRDQTYDGSYDHCDMTCNESGKECGTFESAERDSMADTVEKHNSYSSRTTFGDIHRFLQEKEDQRFAHNRKTKVRREFVQGF